MKEIIVIKKVKNTCKDSEHVWIETPSQLIVEHSPQITESTRMCNKCGTIEKIFNKEDNSSPTNLINKFTQIYNKLKTKINTNKSK